MRNNKILKAFCLSAALLLVSLTASQARAAAKCLEVYPNSDFCQGWVANSPGGTLDGPLSATAEHVVCSANSATSTCVGLAGEITFNFANGSSITSNWTGQVGASSGCVAASPQPGTAEFCPQGYASSLDFTLKSQAAGCLKKGKPWACCTGTTPGTGCDPFPNALCTGKTGDPSCCTGKGTGNCDTVCVITSSESCPTGDNCVQLSTFAAAGYAIKTDAGAVVQYASDVDAAGVGPFVFGNDLNNASTPLTGCTLNMQFSANKAITVSTFTPDYNLTGSCALAKTSFIMRCQGVPQ